MSLDVKFSTLYNSDGSAELILGNTKVAVSVVGPIEPKMRQELPNSSSLEIVVRPSVGVSSTRERLIEDKIRSLLQNVIVTHRYPRQLIQIVVQFLVTDGNSASGTDNSFTANELNAAINCCFFALIDGNIALNYSFASAAVGLLGNKLVFNPTLEELRASSSHHVICFSIHQGKSDNVLLLESQGKFVESELFQVIDNGSTSCEQMHQSFQRQAIESKVKRDFIWKGWKSQNT